MPFNNYRQDGHSPAGSPVSQHGANPRARDGRPAQKQSLCAQWLCPICSKLVPKARAAEQMRTLACQFHAHEHEQEELWKVNLQEEKTAVVEASRRNKNDGREGPEIEEWVQTAKERNKNRDREWPSEPEAATGGDEELSNRMTNIYEHELERKSVWWNTPPLAKHLANSRLAKNFGSSPPSTRRQPSQDHVLSKLSGQTLKAAVSRAPSFLGWRLESIFR